MTEDITPAVLRQIREDIANLDASFDAKMDVKLLGVRAEIADLRREVRQGFAHTNEQLGAVVALMGRLAKNEEHLDARIDAIEARLAEPR